MALQYPLGLRVFCVMTACLMHAGLLLVVENDAEQQVVAVGKSATVLALSFANASNAEKTVAIANDMPKQKRNKPTAVVESVSLDSISVEQTPLADVEINAEDQELILAEVSQEDSEIELIAVTESAPKQADVSVGVHEDIVSKPTFSAPPIPPRYPRLARKRGQEGVVWLDIWLDRDGKQTRLEVVDSSGIDSLDLAAIDAVNGWQFMPRKSGAFTVASRVRIPVEFSLH